MRLDVVRPPGERMPRRYSRHVAISADHEGRQYPATTPFEVTRQAIAEFAAALGDDNPAYFSDDAVAPPTFAAVIAAQAWDGLFSDPDLELELRRTIHADQSFDIARPLRVGDVVTATLTIDRVRQRGATEMVTVAVAICDKAGERVCTASSMLIHNREEAE